MKTHLRRAAVALAAVSMTVGLAACGSAEEAGDNADDGGGKNEGPLTIGLLLPENETARYEDFDRPLIEKKLKELAGDDTEIIYNNAKEDANLQQRQVDTMITKDVDALILDAVDSKSIRSAVIQADEAGIPVVAYDRLAEGPISGYTSFDNTRVGKVQGEALLEALGDKADDGQIVMLNGSATDPNAAMFKAGAHSVLDGKVKIGREYDVKKWKAVNANKEMKGAITSLGKENIVGVYAGNDSMAGGAITAMKAAGMDPLPPITGQDAELAGVQRIVTGEQYMSVYKPYKPEADAAAEMAVKLARGESVDSVATGTVDSPTTKDVPAVLIDPIKLTKDNIKETVVKDGLWTIEQICTDRYKSACEDIGLL